MNPVLSRVIGGFLMVVAILGILLSISGMIITWRLERTATERALMNINLVLEGLETTTEGLIVANNALEASQTNVLAITEIISDTARTLNNSLPMVDTFTVLAGEDLPETVRTAQTSLTSAQEGARVIDRVLNTLNRIPFIGNIYTPPEIPLHEALGQVSESLDSLPQTFATMESSLSVTGSNLRVVEADIQEMVIQIGTINRNLEEARSVIDQYQETTGNFSAQMENLRTSLPGWINTLAWTFTILFLWMGLSQIGLMVYGFELMNYRPHYHFEPHDQ